MLAQSRELHSLHAKTGSYENESDQKCTWSRAVILIYGVASPLFRSY